MTLLLDRITDTGTDLDEMLQGEIPCEADERVNGVRAFPQCGKVAAFRMSLICRRCGMVDPILTCAPCTALLRQLMKWLLPFLGLSKVARHDRCRRPIWFKLTVTKL